MCIRCPYVVRKGSDCSRTNDDDIRHCPQDPHDHMVMTVRPANVTASCTRLTKGCHSINRSDEVADDVRSNRSDWEGQATIEGSKPSWQRYRFLLSSVPLEKGL